MKNDEALVNLDVAMVALAECKTAMEAKQIADVAEAARVYLERTNASAATVNRATEIRLLAERQMGEFLKTMPKATGAKGIGTSAVPEGNRTLAQIGITKKQSSTAQRLADIPADEFKERVALAKANGEKLTTAKVMPPPKRSKPFKMPARGLFLARGAICELEKIQPSDAERKAAITFVRDWCNSELESLP